VSYRRFIIDVVSTFAVALAASAVVTFLWNLVFSGSPSVDWETSFRFAIILGVVLPLSQAVVGRGRGE
jgi:hypothetical protein